MIEEAKTKIGNYTVYVTIQFGHNDQKVTSGVNVTEYGGNLERFGRDVQEVGGIAVSVLCLLSFCLLPSLFEILLGGVFF